MLDLLTEDSMRLCAIHHGARKKNASAVELHTLCFVTHRGSGPLVTIIKCEPIEQFVIKGKALFAAMYISELLIKAIKERDSVVGIFSDYKQVLEHLSSATTEMHATLRSFERKLLRGIGFEIVFNRQLDGQAIAPQQHYSFEPGSGFEPVNPATGEGFSGHTLLAIHRDDYSAKLTRQAAKFILQSSLTHHFGPNLLKSSHLFKLAL